MTEHVMVWDVETVPDVEAVARVRGMPNMTPDQVREALGGEFPRLPLHRIICIGALICSSSAKGWKIESLGAPHIGERAEHELITSFVERIGSLRPQLVTFNGGSFDLPVLRYRAMLHRVSASGLFVRPYFNRYLDDSIDLCDVLASYDNRAKVSLDLLCKALGLGGKPPGIAGADVERLFASGKIQQIADYCETDIVNTYRIWLLFELFRGTTSHEAWEESEKNLQQFILQRAQTKPHLRALIA